MLLVVDMSLWPSHSWISLSETPLAYRRLAHECLRSWKRIRRITFFSRNSSQCLNDLLGYALYSQFIIKDPFAGIYLLIGVFEDYLLCFLAMPPYTFRVFSPFSSSATTISPTSHDDCFLITTISVSSMPASTIESPDAFRI